MTFVDKTLIEDLLDSTEFKLVERQFEDTLNNLRLKVLKGRLEGAPKPE